MSEKPRILYVDDEKSNLNIFKNTFRRSYVIFTAESALEGMAILEKEKVDIILSDQRMPEMTGVEFLKDVLKRYPQPCRILITAYTDFDALKDAINDADIFQYIQKPWDEKKVQVVLNNALEVYRLRQQNTELMEQLRVQNEQLKWLNEELIDLDKLKFQFLNTMSHEIRTPLNGLLGATSYLKSELEGEMYRKYKDLFEILDVSTKRLESFLMLAERITVFKSKSYRMEPHPFSLNKLIRNTLSLLDEKMVQKNLKVDLNLFEEDGNSSFADSKLLEICLFEVLDNAIKFSPENGAISINSSIVDEKHIVKVQDKGPGFPDHVLKHIFKPFVSHNESATQGMGLDLALINLILESHGGYIDISNNEEGATVEFGFKKLEEACI